MTGQVHGGGVPRVDGWVPCRVGLGPVYGGPGPVYSEVQGQYIRSPALIMEPESIILIWVHFGEKALFHGKL